MIGMYLQRNVMISAMTQDHANHTLWPQFNSLNGLLWNR